MRAQHELLILLLFLRHDWMSLSPLLFIVSVTIIFFFLIVIAVWSLLEASIINLMIPVNFKSDLLILNVHSANILLISIYHPYWGICKEHELLEDIIQEVIDRPTFSQFSIYLVGDINDFRLHCSNFLQSNSLVQIVSFPTRGKNTLDVICVPISVADNYNTVNKSSGLGRSDHCVITVLPVEVATKRQKIKT